MLGGEGRELAAEGRDGHPLGGRLDASGREQGGGRRRRGCAGDGREDAGAEGRGAIRQGMLEASNVNVVEELVDMIETQRAYEINSKLISAVDEMLRNANQTL